MHGGIATDRIEFAHFLAAQRIRRQLRAQHAHQPPQLVPAQVGIDMALRPRREHDILLPRLHLLDALRFRAVGAPQVHHEADGIDTRFVDEHRFQRRVRIQAAVPVKFAVDAHRRKARRHRAACHHVRNADVLLQRIEIVEPAAGNADRADRQAYAFRVVERAQVDQCVERCLERAGVVEARLFRRHLQADREGIEPAQRIETRHAAKGRVERIEPGIEAACRIRHATHVEQVAVRNAIPEFPDPGKPMNALVSRDQCAIDGADRRAHHPVGRQPMLVQRLVDARLISAQRAAALQHQYHARPCRRCSGGGRQGRD